MPTRPGAARAGRARARRTSAAPARGDRSSHPHCRRCGTAIRRRALTSVGLMARLTRGPLPARVYWVRRLLVLGTAFALVLGIGHLLSGGSDATSGEDAAAQ